MSFASSLQVALAARGHACVGIDPHAGLLEQWGLADDLPSLQRFADLCVEALAGTAAVVKPQSAFFERFGSAGVAVLARTVAACRAGGALVILDVKRGDIGSTMAAYADAYLDPRSDLAADAITVTPFLGVGSLTPAFEAADRHGAGVFVLCLTSNKEGPDVQHARTADGRTVARAIVEDVAERNADRLPFGSIGLVVGATIGDSVADLTGFNGPFLVPGVGAQGGTPEDVRRIFGSRLPAVVPSISREVLRHGPSVTGLRAATERCVEQFGYLQA